MSPGVVTFTALAAGYFPARQAASSTRSKPRDPSSDGVIRPLEGSLGETTRPLGESEGGDSLVTRIVTRGEIL